MLGYKDAKMPFSICMDIYFYDARMQKCKDAKMQGCKDAMMQGCKDARMQGCKDAIMQR